MSKLISKLSRQKKAADEDKHTSQVVLETDLYNALKQAVKEDGLSIQKVLQAGVEVYLEERKK